MTDYRFEAATAQSLSGLKANHVAGLRRPLDGMWQAFAAMATQHAIECNGRVVGFCAIGDDQKLLQFYLQPGHDAQQVFTAAVATLGITGAVVASGEADTLAVCLDHQTSISVGALMYEVNEAAPVAEPCFPDHSAFRALTSLELDAAVDFAHAALGADKDWLRGYYGDLIAGQALHGLWLEGTLIATGELRPSASQQTYADVGMVVSANQRRKGIATNMLRQLLKLCGQAGLKPVCSTEVGNVGAQRAIKKAGFVASQRLLEISF
jgi:GNAT superfamily N-acetyltransferase